MDVGVDEIDADLVDELEALAAEVELVLEERDLEGVAHSRTNSRISLAAADSGPAANSE